MVQFRQFIRNGRDDRRVRGVFAVHVDEFESIIGWSLCNRKDRFNKTMGIKIAEGRLDHAGIVVNNNEIERVNIDDIIRDNNIPNSIAEDLRFVLNRCRRIVRSFSDKS